jgi:sRNA-binding carbon storage regulator CsrA
MPLVLERKVNESVMIWDESDPNQILVVTLKRAVDGSYQMVFEGPRNFRIFRKEMLDDNSFEDKK